MKLIRDRVNLPTQREYTPEGYLKVPACIARSGIQIYSAAEVGFDDLEPDAVVRVYRPDDEVFKTESTNSFLNLTLTNDHPPELVDASNYIKYNKGNSGTSISRVQDKLQIDLFFKDAQTIKDIGNGKNEISNGYIAEITREEGTTPSGEHYDAIQRNIIGNHIALVSQGRAGPSCSVADSKEKTGEPLMKYKIKGIDYEVSDQVAQAIDELKKDVDDAEEAKAEKEEELKKKDEELKKKEDEAKKKEDEVTKTEDSLKAKLDDALSKVATDEQLDKLASERAEFLSQISKLSPNFDTKGKSKLDVIKGVVGEHSKNINLDSSSDDYLQARFDLLVEGVTGNTNTTFDTAIASHKKEQNDNAPSMTPKEKARAGFIDARNPQKRGAK